MLSLKLDEFWHYYLNLNEFCHFFASFFWNINLVCWLLILIWLVVSLVKKFELILNDVVLGCALTRENDQILCRTYQLWHLFSCFFLLFFFPLLSMSLSSITTRTQRSNCSFTLLFFCFIFHLGNLKEMLKL